MWLNDECPVLAKPKRSPLQLWGPAPNLATENGLRNTKLHQIEDKKGMRKVAVARNGSVHFPYQQRLKGIIKEDLGSPRKDNVVFSTLVLNWRTQGEDSYPLPNIF